MARITHRIMRAPATSWKEQPMGFRDTLTKARDSAKDVAKEAQVERQDRRLGKGG